MFGDRDSSADHPEESFLTEAAARARFAGVEVVRSGVEDEDGVAFTGPNHWHVFDVIASAGSGTTPFYGEEGPVSPTSCGTSRSAMQT